MILPSLSHFQLFLSGNNWKARVAGGRKQVQDKLKGQEGATEGWELWMSFFPKPNEKPLTFFSSETGSLYGDQAALELTT
jgi:hypothetical protein